MSSFPMVGSWTVDVAAVRPFTIHGDVYYEVTAARTDDAAPLSLRVPHHAASGLATPLAAGQRVSVAFLMGQVTAVTAVTAG